MIERRMYLSIAIRIVAWLVGGGHDVIAKAIIISKDKINELLESLDLAI